MAFFRNSSLAVALVGAITFSLVAIQGCSSDEQHAPGGGGSGSSHAGSSGKPSTAGNSGGPESEGGTSGEGPTGAAGEESGGAGGEAGGPSASCDQSFDNSTLDVLTDNGGKLPDLP